MRDKLGQIGFAFVMRAGAFAARAGRYRQPGLKLLLDLIGAIGKRFNARVAFWIFRDIGEYLFDTADDHMLRNAALLPSLDQRPIEWAEQKALPTKADKGFFDLGKIIEVVQRV